MRIDCSPAKDQINIGKHGFSLWLAEEFDWSAGLFREGHRGEDGERRWVMLTVWQDAAYAVVFTLRDRDTMWVMSLRPASRKERKLL